MQGRGRFKMIKRILLLILGLFLLPSTVFAGLSNASLVGYYAFEESGSPYGSIGTGNTNSLTGSSSPTQSAGIISYGQLFDGSGNCVSGTHADYSNLADEFSIALWFKGTLEGNQYATILSRFKWGGGALGIRSESSGNPGLVKFEAYSTSPNSIATAETDLNDNQWHQIVAVLDNGDRYIYVDGALSDDDTYTGSNPTASEIFSIGCRTDDRHAQGTIDEVSIWSIALDASNVTYLYNSGAPTSAQQPPFSTPADPAINDTNNVVGAPTNFDFNISYYYNAHSNLIDYNWTDLQQTMTNTYLQIRYFGNGTYILNNTITSTDQTGGNIQANITDLVDLNYTIRALAYLEDAERVFLVGNTTLVGQLWVFPDSTLNYTVYSIEAPEGIFWAVGIFMTLILMGAAGMGSASGALFMGIAGMWFISLLGFAEMSRIVLITFTLMGGILIWGMRGR